MDIKRIVTLYWSASGNTRQVVMTLGQTLSRELSLPCEHIDFTPFNARQREYEFAATDFVVIGSPTFAGKLPNKILPDFKRSVQGHGTPCMAVVTYGNRAFDNSLAELCAVLKDNKMHVVAATAAPCRHSFTDLLAKGRPDGEDMRALIAYGTRLAAYIKAKDILPDTPLIPGDADAPYYVPKGIDGKPAKFLKAKPKTDMDLCISCGTCAVVCPMGSIDSEDTSVVSGICIKCQACVYSCPKKAKYFDDPALLSHIAMLKENYGDAGTDRKGIEFFPSLP